MFYWRRRQGFGRPMRVGRGNRYRSSRESVRSRTRFGFPVNVRLYFYRSRRRRGGRRTTWGSPERPTPLPTAPEPTQETLQVEDVDLKVGVNTKAHYTDEFEIAQGPDACLVVRRGQPFDLKLIFNKAYDAKTDDLRLIFEAGDSPQKSKGTLVEFILSAEDHPKKWGAKILSQKGHELTITVFTPPTCYVGKWEFNVDVIKKDEANEDRYRYTHDDKIYVLFNPWCKDDTVFLEKKEHRDEYVLNDSGRIYAGNSKQITSKPWSFGQFESICLDASLHILDVAGMNWAVRGNPIMVVRKISALVNSNDEGGVLVGKWGKDYSGGRTPLSWTGSVDILRQYYTTKQPVCFGQCWVFSGVTTTVLRALGIPARSVTNFSSAHDTDGSISLDFHFTAEGEPDTYEDSDSIWNFHVWNECWLARPDLPEGFGGWQCIDSTPQETSDDVYCCGPVSVQAVKHGEVNMPFDGPFVFAEVNADKVFWIQTPQGYEVAGMDKRGVGKYISTKAVGSDQREDITNLYKPEEGSAAERAAVMKANQVGSTREDIYHTGTEDVEFNIEQDSDNSWIGEDFKITLTMKNTSAETRNVNGRIVIKSMFYTGVTDQVIKSIPFKTMELKAGANTTKQIVVSEDDYGDKLQDCCMFDVSFWAFVKETQQTFTRKEDYRLKKPHLTVKGPKEVKVNSEFDIQVSFTNPLKTSLTLCAIEVNGLAKAVKFPQKNIPAKSTFNATVHVTPSKIGHKELIIMFDSRQLLDINAVHPVFIKS